MSWNSIANKAKLIVRDAPRDWLENLLPWDGISQEAGGAYVKDMPLSLSSFYAFELMGGAAGAHVSGLDSVNWLTPLGQAVVDELNDDSAAQLHCKWDGKWSEIVPHETGE